jgi:hypothetical protein
VGSPFALDDLESFKRTWAVCSACQLGAHSVFTHAAVHDVLGQGARGHSTLPSRRMHRLSRLGQAWARSDGRRLLAGRSSRTRGSCMPSVVRSVVNGG